MSLREGVLAHARNLPTDLCSGSTTSDLETVSGDLLGDVEVGAGSADRGELVAKVAVERREPVRKFDHRLAIGIDEGCAVVDVLHLRGFDGGVHQVLVGWIQGMVDFE